MMHTILLQAAAPSAMGQGVQTLIMIGLMVIVFWFLVWRPQGKEQARLEGLQNKLKAGDEVVTASGILGKVVRVDNRIVTLEISKGNKMKVLLSQIQGLQSTVLKENEAAQTAK